MFQYREISSNLLFQLAQTDLSYYYKIFLRRGKAIAKILGIIEEPTPNCLYLPSDLDITRVLEDLKKQ